MRAKADQIVPMSFLPLIDKDVPLAATKDTYKKLSYPLTKAMIKQAQDLLK